MLKRLLKFVVFVLGVAVLINSLVLTFTTNFNLGNVLTFGLAVVLLCFSVIPKFIRRFVPKFIRYTIIAAIFIAVAFSTFLMCFGLSDTASKTEDAIIVLGAAVHGETPSLVLRDRLDVAFEYHKQNPEAYLIVSGGKGNQEDVSEAEAMEKYLINKGVAADKIIKEDKATSTAENFKYSKEILENLLGDEYNVGFITNEYHVYRAAGIAKNAGFAEFSHLHSSTRWYSVLPGTLRECLAVVKFWVFGN